jgi:putative transposase
MERPLPLEFAGAIYHLTNRGNDRQKAFCTDAGRELFLNALAQVVRLYGWLCRAYCLPTNRYHLMA